MAKATYLEDFLQDLGKQVGGDLRTDQVSRILYSTDASIYQVMPYGVLLPQTTDDVQAAVELAAKYQVPLLPRTDGRTLASAAANKIRIWDMETGELLYMLPGYKRIVLDIEFSPDGKQLASAGADGTTRIFILPIKDLMALVRSRLTRSLTEDECQRYLQIENCR